MTCRYRARDYVGLSDGISVTVSVPSNKVRVVVSEHSHSRLISGTVFNCHVFSSMGDRLEMRRIICLFHIYLGKIQCE